jgi:hypothetical protein
MACVCEPVGSPSYGTRTRRSRVTWGEHVREAPSGVVNYKIVFDGNKGGISGFWMYLDTQYPKALTVFRRTYLSFRLYSAGTLCYQTHT